MSEDASLDSFAPGESDSEETDTPAESDDHEADELSSDSQVVEPATSTYEWSPAGQECDHCGDTVARRWRDDDVLVCQDCKSW
ncbi:DUF7573 domain-containing protein [Halorussus halophilus]|uniref:DUF7573 domain-containing protein n=1 Tax=Halorussus halophilus TaxID=2650975 RepID=UPI0013011ED4|nr:hypothetical protein [Halorussus halophilus]